jgi:hypothetical protein
MEIRSVNTLRWDGRSWWAASTDGPGMLIVAEAFGHDTSGVLGINGGGGTARSVAAAWCQTGGSIKQLGGNRLLEDDGPWTFSDAEPSVTIDFDNDGGDLLVRYQPMDGDFDSRIEMLSKVADGRWLLCAQHLMSWASMWAPKYAEHLPSISLLMTRLVAVEVNLS